MKNHRFQSDISEIEFRIQFKKDFGIDYLDALKQIESFEIETERNWNQLLVKYNLI